MCANLPRNFEFAHLLELNRVNMSGSESLYGNNLQQKRSSAQINSVAKKFKIKIS